MLFDRDLNMSFHVVQVFIDNKLTSLQFTDDLVLLYVFYFCNTKYVPYVP